MIELKQKNTKSFNTAIKEVDLACQREQLGSNFESYKTILGTNLIKQTPNEQPQMMHEQHENERREEDRYCQKLFKKNSIEDWAEEEERKGQEQAREAKIRTLQQLQQPIGGYPIDGHSNDIQV